MLSPLFLTRFVGIAFACARMLVGAFSVIYLLRMGVTIPQIGLLKSFQAAVIVLIDIPLSYVSDNYSRKLSIALAILCAALWLLITGFGISFSTFLIAEFFNALSLGLMSGTYSAYLYDVNKAQNKKEKRTRRQSPYLRFIKNINFFSWDCRR